MHKINCVIIILDWSTKQEISHVQLPIGDFSIHGDLKMCFFGLHAGKRA